MVANEDWSQYYDETDIDQAHESWDEDKKKSERIRAKRPEQGEHLYRFLPKRKGAKHEHFYRIVYIHYLRNPNERDSLLMVGLCPQKMEGKECVLCTGYNKLRKAGKQWKELREYGLAPQRKVLAGAVRMGPKGTPLEGDDGKPFVMDLPDAVEKVVFPLLDRSSSRFFGDISHPFNGINLAIERKGSGRENTEYTAMPFTSPTPLANLAWLKELPDLDNIEELVGVQQAQTLLAEHYPETGYLPPVPSEGGGAQGGGAADDDDEYELVTDPDNPGQMITRKELRERGR